MPAKKEKYRRVTNDQWREERVRSYLDLRALLRNAISHFAFGDGERSLTALNAFLDATNPNGSYWSFPHKRWTWGGARGYWALRFYKRAAAKRECAFLQPSQTSDAMWSALALGFTESRSGPEVKRFAEVLLKCRSVKDKGTFNGLKHGLEDWRLRLMLQVMPKDHLMPDHYSGLDAALHSDAAGRILMSELTMARKE